MNAALAAAATLVAVGFALQHARSLAAAAPPARHWRGRSRWRCSRWARGRCGGPKSHGWSLARFRVFYLAGAVLNVPWLALGTVYLLAGRAVGRPTSRWWLVAAQLASAPASCCSRPPHDPVSAAPSCRRARTCSASRPRVLAAVGSGVAALVIIVGALWSAWRLARATRARARRACARTASSPGRLVVGNLLIAAGTLVLSASGTLAGRLGQGPRVRASRCWSASSVLFAGFLVASERHDAPRRCCRVTSTSGVAACR